MKYIDSIFFLTGYKCLKGLFTSRFPQNYMNATKDMV